MARILFQFMIAACTSSAIASPGKSQTTVLMKVESCQAITVESPEDAHPMRYIPNQKVKTALVYGSVEETFTYSWQEVGPPRPFWLQSPTPKVKEWKAIALTRWDAEFCKAVVGKLQRFRLGSGCDTLPRFDICIIPLQLAMPVPDSQKWPSFVR